MRSPLELDDLIPAVTIFPLRLTMGRQAAATANELHTRVEELVSVDPRSGERRRDVLRIEMLDPEIESGWHFVGAAYLLDQSPSWIKRLPKGADDTRKDVKSLYRQRVWHLALVGVKRETDDRGWVVVHATQDSIAALLREWLVAGRFGTLRLGIAAAVPFKNTSLQAVALDGAAKQAALTGVHRSTTTKPDRKTLLGLDLREAVDPFGDQTFRLTSAVSKSASRTPDMLGLSLSAQRLWSSRKRTFGEFTAVLDSLYDLLEQAETLPAANALALRAGLDQPGYSTLARPEPPTAIAAATNAFDAAFRPATDLDPIDGAVDAKKQRLEQLELLWFEDGTVRLLDASATDASFTLQVSKGGRHLLDLTVTPTADETAVALPVTSTYPNGISPDDPSIELFEQLIEGDGLGARLAVWYDSGHVLVQNQISTLAYQDVLFDGWTWQSFSIGGIDYRVDQEKPMKLSSKPNKWVADLDAIGTAQSLFDFSLVAIPPLMGNPGDLWTFCDDGSGEVADFVFFDPIGKQLWLVHAKAADSNGVARGISVSAYEQVASQARKNLRYLDAKILATEIRQRNDALPRIWRNGAKVAAAAHAAARAELCDALEAIAFYEDKRMVVLQPHVRKQSWDEARGDLASGNDTTQRVKSYRLLSALLADLQITAQKMGIRFQVIGDG